MTLNPSYTYTVRTESENRVEEHSMGMGKQN